MVDFLNRVWEAITRRIDNFLFGCALALVGVGIVTLFSATDQSVARVTTQLFSFGFALVLISCAAWVWTGARIRTAR